jgi:hypothetical protein
MVQNIQSVRKYFKDELVLFGVVDLLAKSSTPK